MTASVGTQLQQARQERKLSLSEVTRETKIQPWVLEALEGDRLQEMMSPVYVKGFLTTYARFLRLDSERLIALIRWPQPEPVQEELPPPPPRKPMAFKFKVKLPPRPVMRRLAGAAAVAAAVVGIIILKPSPAAPPAAGPVAAKLASVSGVANALKPSASPTLTLLATQPLELHVSAHRTTWIRVRADGKLLAQQRLPRGANERWLAKKQFELVISKPAQVDVTLNGQSISPFAIANRGRLLITHHGVTQLPEE